MRPSITTPGLARAKVALFATIFSTCIFSKAAADTNCAALPVGLVSWWRAETNALDQADGNNGTLIGNTTYGLGRTGTAFVFDGNTDAVSVGNPTNLQLQNFTIEAWVKRSSASVATLNPDGAPGVGCILCYSWGGYGFYLRDDGHIGLGKIGSGGVVSSLLMTDTTRFHHVAVTKSGGAIVFYVDGVMDTSATFYDPGFVFNGPAAIGARGEDWGSAMYGSIDEVAVYNRTLSAAEIQAIYNSGDAGKCIAPSPPFVFAHPIDQSVTAGSSVLFNVTAGGSQPLNYQWRKDSAPLSDATNTTLFYTSVSTNTAGEYDVVITNFVGSVTSHVATLTIMPDSTNCVSPPSGLAGWWRAENNADDLVAANNGSFLNGASYVAGEVGQAFSFTANGSYVRIPASPTLNVGAGGGLTIEAWINPADLTTPDPIVEWALSGAYAVHFYANSLASGRLYANLVAVDGSEHTIQTASSVLTSNSYQHVALTYDKASGVARLLRNGVVFQESVLGSFTPRTSPDMYIGYRPPTSPAGSVSFKGEVDEVSIYNRALSPAEIESIYNSTSAGKCQIPFAPTIAAHPTNRTVSIGSSTTFAVAAGGTPPLSYHWYFNTNSVIVGATNASLTINPVLIANAGVYTCIVTNNAGAAASSNATLTITYPVVAVRVSGTNIASTSTFSVPVLLTANGNENALSFSLNFNPSLLNCSGVTLGSSATGAALFPVTSGVSTGRLGVAVGWPSPDQTFSFGTQELVRVSFTSAIVATNATSQITFTDSPIIRRLSDGADNTLSANYTAGTVTVLAADFEGDVSPRPNGNRSVTFNDWQLVGQYAARLNYPTNSVEFQRADCAPRLVQGNGLITVSDWVQAGRYLAGYDSPAVAGGPTNEMSFAPPNGSFARKLKTANVVLLQNSTGTMAVNLESQGDENALGFSLIWDPASLSYESAALGNASSGATLNVNTSQTASGRVGIVLALPTGTTYPAGIRETVTVNFRSSSIAGGNILSFADIPVPREVTSVLATALQTEYVNGSFAVNPPPLLRIAQSGQNIMLAWPSWATNFGLQASDVASANWTNLVATPSVINGENVVLQPIGPATQFYRLCRP